MKNSPPRVFLRFFRWYVHPKLRDHIEGDLIEVYNERLKNSGKRKADRKFIADVLLLFRPGIVRPLNDYKTLNTAGMYKNYFKIAIRNLLKQKVYSSINIGGLSVGLASFILILLYVQHEFSYDRFHKNADRIYRVYQRQGGNMYMGTDYFAVTPALLPSVMEQEFPEVEEATAISQQTALLRFENDSFWEPGLWADNHFFRVFSYPFMKGDPKTALKDPKGMIITQSLAAKIFGEKDPIGQTIKYGSDAEYFVTGVIFDPPANSSFQFSFISNVFSSEWHREELNRTTWKNNSMHTFFLLAEGASPLELKSKFPALLKKYRDPKAYEHYPFNDEYFVEELAALHLRSGISFDIGVKGNVRYVYLFSIVALIVLLLACVNYTNLAVARSIKRAREVGLRKVVGAVKAQLMRQFLGESVLIAFVSLLLAVGLTILLLPFFGNLMERRIQLDFFGNPLLLPGLFLLVILVGVSSGSYPAFIMASLRPIHVLSGKLAGKLSGFRLQRALIVVQYAVSIVMVIGSLVIYRQIRYMQNMELGYDKENVVTIPVRDRELTQHYENLSVEWKQQPGIIASTLTSHLPTNITSSHLVNDEDGSGPEDDVAIYECRAHDDFLKVFGIKLAAGRTFSRDITTDKDAYLINETAAKALGWTPDEAVGKEIIDDGRKTIVGVMKDFHMHSMHLPIQPLMIRYSTDWVSFISVKVNPEKLRETLAFLEGSLKKVTPYPFQYQLLDDNFDQLYKSEMKLGEIFGFFTIVSILIASLGLFGLAAFSSDQRTKEIGIRKVLGASVENIVFLLTKDFLTLVLISFVISVPIAWYAMHRWLQDFAYRIEIEWWMFAGAGVLAFCIANIAIGSQSLKASLSNPVDNLRSE